MFSLEQLNLSKRKFATVILLDVCIHGKNYDVKSHMVWWPSWIEKRTFSDWHETSQTSYTPQLEAESEFVMS